MIAIRIIKRQLLTWSEISFCTMTQKGWDVLSLFFPFHRVKREKKLVILASLGSGIYCVCFTELFMIITSFEIAVVNIIKSVFFLIQVG